MVARNPNYSRLVDGPYKRARWLASHLRGLPGLAAPPLAGPSRSCRHVARLSLSLALRLFRTRSPPDRFRSLWLPPNGSLTSLSPELRLLPNLIPLALLHVGGPYSLEGLELV